MFHEEEEEPPQNNMDTTPNDKAAAAIVAACYSHIRPCYWHDWLPALKLPDIKVTGQHLVAFLQRPRDRGRRIEVLHPMWHRPPPSAAPTESPSTDLGMDLGMDDDDDDLPDLPDLEPDDDMDGVE